MKKTYQMFLALVAMLLLGAMNVSAEEISLDEVPFWQHETGLWGLDAPKNTQATPAWVVGEPNGQPYGDTSVNNWADLGGFEKLVITYTAGKPRVMLNRDQDEGQFNANEAESHLIEYPKGASSWAGKYFKDEKISDEESVLTVDLKAIVNDKGFAHLHAIKGADWADVTVTSMILVRKGKEKQVGWINILTNGDLEGDDISSFRYVLNGNGSDGNVTFDPVIEDGAGVDGSRGLAITSSAEAAETWSTQLFVVLPEVQPIGTQWRFSMDVISNPNAEVGIGGHGNPREWKCGGADISPDFSSNFTTTNEWKTITAKGTISEKNFGDGFKSIAFDLNLDKTTATQYYFDNFKFEIYKYGTVAEFSSEAVQVDFGFETNIPELCKAAGKSRVMFPVENAKVLVNGVEAKIISVEGFADGRFYIFLEEAIDDDAEVKVTFINPEGDLQLKYAGGPNAGSAIPNVDEIADFNGEVTDADDVFSYAMLPPTIVAAYPEQGSFNIKSDLKEFKVKFDKLAIAEKITAKLDGNALTVSPAEGLVEEVTLTYAGPDMRDGLHTINITNIFPENDGLELFTDSTYQFSVGAPDPNDVPVELIPLSYFNSCGMNSIPEGFKLYADNMEVREAGGSYGGGSRFFNDFGAGGDFTGALYMRSNYVTYGLNDDTHRLTMEAGKPYTLSFNTARWKSSGEFMKVQILDQEGVTLYEQTVTCNPDVNGTKNAVNKSSAYTINFTPEVSGDYELRFVVAKNADGEDAGEEWHEMLLANVKMGYLPTTFGIAEMIALNEALEKAKKTQADNADERFDGAAQTALNEAIVKVEAEKDNYTSPSECNAATELLEKTGADLIAHANLCKDYDQKIKDGSDVVRQHANDKFAALELYAQLVELVNKYHGVSVMQNDGTEEEPNWQKHYTYDVLKDDAALATAVAELTDIVNTTSKLFTTGQSKRNTTGVAALVERLRLGAEALKALGFAETDYPVADALNALDDDDALAESVKSFIKKDIYGKIKDDATGSVFSETVVDPETLEETSKAKEYDMTAFVKNPNLYAREFTTEVPGWETIAGNPTAWSSWDGNVSHNTKTPYVEDCCIYLQWHAACNVEQTITDLPAGIYTIRFSANDNSATSDGTYVYVKTTETPAVEEGMEVNPDVNYAGYAQVDNTTWDREISNIVVKDGVLTLGFISGTVSQPFLEEVHLALTGKAEGFDYAKAYGETETGIENVKVAKVNDGVIYNLAGQKVNKSFKGLVIMNGKKIVVK